MNKGVFIVFEGNDGSGKTTQVNKVINHLSKDREVVSFREPGDTKIGEIMRKTMFNNEMCGETELFLLTTSRVHLIKTEILPALAAGKIVLLDRFLMSTRAYQGYGKNILEQVIYIEKYIEKLLIPDITIFLSVPLEVAEKRMIAREGQITDRFDSAELAFKTKVRQGYLDTVQEKSKTETVFTIDASVTEDEVFKNILNALKEVVNID